MPFSSYLLSIFAKDKAFGAHLDALVYHYHILSIIYLGSAVTFSICFVETFICNYFESTSNFSLSGMALSGFLLSMIFLKKGKQNAAGITMLIYLHCINLVAGLQFEGFVMGTLMGAFAHIHFCYFLTKSTRVVVVNNLFTFGEFIIYIRKLLNIYHVTLTQEQNREIVIFSLVMICVFMIISMITYLQKKVECNLWKLLNENYQKSENLTKEVVQAITSKDNFVSSLSHEVRNVLNSLNGSVDYLLSVLKDSPHLQILKNARMSGEILFNLVSNALDAAKIRADKLELSYGNANIEDIIRKAFIINSENLKSKNIFAKALIDSQIPKNLWVDSGRILQILMNLMSNALKFTPQRGQIKIDVVWCKQNQACGDLLDPFNDDDKALRETHIPSFPNTSLLMNQSLQSLDESVLEFSIEEEQAHQTNLTRLQSFPSLELRRNRRSSQRLLYSSENCQIQATSFNNLHPSLTNVQNENSESGFLKIQVSDTGCGIPKDSLPKLFEMYIQADNTISSTYGGTGLGLWICKQLCHKMQGDITVYSQSGIGSKFVFYIPVDNVRKNAEVTVTREHINALVVDDYDFNRNLHKLLLEREGVQVTLAQNGLEAVQRYKERGEGYFDFIFMDISMPIMDGFAATKEIRLWEAEHHLKQILIYFVSGEYFNDKEVSEVLKNSGGLKELTNIRFLRKPIEVEMVAEIVKGHR